MSEIDKQIRENDGEITNFDRFRGMFSSDDTISKMNTAFAFYLEENYRPKERGDKSLATECCKFPAWLFSVYEGEVR